ncbi:F-box protein CPR1-like [Lycium barbarum]|uniref:F-box protein CPR1-like n=1 Tax=Lycium barbarum TaxID=112863 RepID=UPI00293E2B87|nr:F-box protein CPR1-like [Lycium barbarum]
MGNGIMKILPNDVAISILLRFPVKSLMRYRGISKIWCTLLQSSYFINLHLMWSSITEDEFILVKRSFEERPGQFKHVLSFFSNVSDNDYLNPVSPDLDVPYLASNYGSVSLQVSMPCNGLIALNDTLSIVLLNPTTRKYNLLHPSSFGYPHGFDRDICGVGFGFDLMVNDYKVVRISEIYSDPYKDPCVTWIKVEIYDLGIDSWREQNYEDKELPSVFWNPCAEIFYRGACHWFATANTLQVILCFDMSTDIFRDMKMPDTCYRFDGKCYGLVVLNKSLTLICYRDPTCEIDLKEDFMDIWTMKVYGVNDSWIKRYSIRPLPIKSPLTIWKNLLLFQSKSGQLISYNFYSDEVREFNLYGYQGSLRVVLYKESLTSVSREKGHGTQAQQM